MHTHTHTRTHTLTHMQMRAHTKRRQDVHIGSMRVCMYTLLNIKPYTCLLAYAYIKKYFAHIYIYIYIHTNMHTYVPPQHSTEGLGAAQHGKTRPCMHTLHYTALHYPVLHTYIYPSIHPSIHPSMHTHTLKSYAVIFCVLVMHGTLPKHADAMRPRLPPRSL